MIFEPFRIARILRSVSSLETASMLEGLMICIHVKGEMQHKGEEDKKGNLNLKKAFVAFFMVFSYQQEQKSEPNEFRLENDFTVIKMIDQMELFEL